MPSVVASGMSSVAALAETGRGYEKGNGAMKGKGKGCDILAGTAETSRAAAAVVIFVVGDSWYTGSTAGSTG